jgi:hypothetical protein
MDVRQAIHQEFRVTFVDLNVVLPPSRSQGRWHGKLRTRRPLPQSRGSVFEVLLRRSSRCIISCAYVVLNIRDSSGGIGQSPQGIESVFRLTLVERRDELLDGLICNFLDVF